MIKQLKGMGKRIIFVRHGESIGNARGLDDNSLADLPNHRFPLTGLGLSEGRQAGEILKKRNLVWQKAFHSTYLRPQATYREIHSIFPCCLDKPIIDSRLDEWWRGVWHTMSKADIARLYPLEEQIQKREGWYHHRAPGGQSGPDVELQIYSFLADYLYGCYQSYRSIMLVGHGKWAILFWRIMNEATVDEAKQFLQNSPFGNCSISIVDGSGFNKIELPK